MHYGLIVSLLLLLLLLLLPVCELINLLLAIAHVAGNMLLLCVLRLLYLIASASCWMIIKC